MWRQADGMNRNDRPVRVVADDREERGGVIEALRAMEGVDLEVRRLSEGDFVVEERFVVERKTLADLAGSVIDARLFRQGTRLVQGARRGVLVLEGTGRDLDGVSVRREALQGALITMGVFYGLALLRSRDVVETARLLLYIGRQARHFAQGAWSRPGYRPKGKRARQLFVLQGLPGLGPGRAARLLDHFGSVQAVAAASAVDLAAVGGIGETTAAHIRWALE